MQRWLIVWFVVSGAGGPAWASPVDEWLRWRMLEDAREAEEQIGLDIGIRSPVDLQLLWTRGDAPLERGTQLVMRRVAMPPEVRIELVIGGGRRAGAGMTLTLLWRGFRCEWWTLRQPRICAIAGSALPARPTGNAPLDHALWSIALAERDALAAIAAPRLGLPGGRPR